MERENIVSTSNNSMVNSNLKKLYRFGLIAIMVGMLACFGSNRLQMVGNQTDEHGCLGPAGYSWSVVLNDCVRMWEVGYGVVPIALKENEYVMDSNQVTYSAYVIFSKDSSKAELIALKENAEPIILERMMEMPGDRKMKLDVWESKLVASKRYRIELVTTDSKMEMMGGVEANSAANEAGKMVKWLLVSENMALKYGTNKLVLK